MSTRSCRLSDIPQDLFCLFLICSYRYAPIAGPTRRGRFHEAHANGEGCGACGSGLASRASGGLGSHRPAQLRGSVRKGWWSGWTQGESPCGIKET